MYLIRLKCNYIFTISKIYSWFWFKKKPINYNPKTLPRSQDAEPVICETTGLYGIRKNALKKNKARIGHRPFMFEVSKKESLDIIQGGMALQRKLWVYANLRIF